MPFHSAQAAYLAFAAAAAVIVATPGVDTALVLRTNATDGTRSAALVAAGTCSGVLIWGGIVAAGLGAILAASQHVYTLLRWTGAAYLGYLGVAMVARPRRIVAAVVSPPSRIRSKGAFSRGLLSNLLNPKIGVFYVTFLPHFVPAHAQVSAFVMTLAVIQAIEAATWFTMLLVMTRPLVRWLQRPAVVSGLDRTTGIVLLAFGAALAVGDV